MSEISLKEVISKSKKRPGRFFDVGEDVYLLYFYQVQWVVTWDSESEQFHAKPIDADLPRVSGSDHQSVLRAIDALLPNPQIPKIDEFLYEVLGLPKP